MSNDNDSIVTYVNYGGIEVDINKQMKKRKLSKSQLIKKGRFNNKTIDSYIDKTISELDLDVLARLCFVLKCDLSDFLVYKRNKK